MSYSSQDVHSTFDYDNAAARSLSAHGWLHLDISNATLRCVSSCIAVCYPWLRIVNLSCNRIRSVDPRVFRGLASLESLNLASNELAELREGWGALRSLRSLDLSRNAIRAVPAEFGQLFLLDSLSLVENPVQNVPRELLGKTDASIMLYLRDALPPPPPPAVRAFVLADAGRAPDRHAFTVFSYNILCDAYATPAMHPHTPSWALDWSYRRELIWQELLASRADVLCLQEVQQREYDGWLAPALAQIGYAGLFKVKSRARTMHAERAVLVDGCAIFYRLVRSRSVVHTT